MRRYANLDGESGVLGYELHEQSIDVYFRSGHRRGYRYSAVRPGLAHVREMQRLARAGRGLATYINQHVRENYERKL